MAGMCRAGQCACDAGWTGSTCAAIKFGRSYRCGQGGMCLAGAHGFLASWGGNALVDGHGQWHAYAASFAGNRTLASWLDFSRVVHAVSCSLQLLIVLALPCLAADTMTCWRPRYLTSDHKDPICFLMLHWVCAIRNFGMLVNDGDAVLSTCNNI